MQNRLGKFPGAGLLSEKRSVKHRQEHGQTGVDRIERERREKRREKGARFLDPTSTNPLTKYSRG